MAKLRRAMMTPFVTRICHPHPFARSGAYASLPGHDGVCLDTSIRPYRPGCWPGLAYPARDGLLPEAPRATALLSNPLIATGAVALAGLEMAGDKMESAPDRTVKRGLAVRIITSAFAGAVLAPRGKGALGAATAITAAMASAYAGLALRKKAMRAYGQVPTGAIEDAVVLAGGLAVTR